MVSPPQITCHMLPYFNPENWGSIDRAFRDAQPCNLQQGWRQCPEPEFRHCCVRIGCSDAALFVYAELQDEDIFNPVTELNAFSYTQGDVFEIFLRPVEQSAYFEFHITPQNQKLQLRFPSAEEFNKLRSGGKLSKDWFISDWVLETRVDVCASKSKWRVLARIPFDVIAEVRAPQSGSQWLFSFSRYDYTRGETEPVLSSSSPHSCVDFHRQEEWGVLSFAHSK